MANAQNMIDTIERSKGFNIGYDQNQRWTFLNKSARNFSAGATEADCSSLAAGCAYVAGFPVDISGTCYSGNIHLLLKAAGWTIYNFSAIGLSGLKPGDVVSCVGAHVVMIDRAGMMYAAHLDEHGHVSGGAAGDQTGGEVSSTAKYMHSPAWTYVCRPPQSPVASPAPPAAAQGNTPAPGNYRVTASSLNIRSGASTGASVLTSVPKGAVVQLMDLTAVASGGYTWWHVLVTVGSKRIVGYAASCYLAK